MKKKRALKQADLDKAVVGLSTDRIRREQVFNKWCGEKNRKRTNAINVLFEGFKHARDANLTGEFFEWFQMQILHRSMADLIPSSLESPLSPWIGLIGRSKFPKNMGC